MRRRRPDEEPDEGPVLPVELVRCVVEDWTTHGDMVSDRSPMDRVEAAELHAFMAHKRAVIEWCVEHDVPPAERGQVGGHGRPVWRDRAAFDEQVLQLRVGRGRGQHDGR